MRELFFLLRFLCLVLQLLSDFLEALAGFFGDLAEFFTGACRSLVELLPRFLCRAFFLCSSLILLASGQAEKQHAQRYQGNGRF